MPTLLIANRGEIARRIARTARDLGWRVAAVATEADRTQPLIEEVDLTVLVGEGPSQDSYLNPSRLLEAARRAGADAVHPGYGFLSENADFAQAVRDAGLNWVGPDPASLRAMGDKASARQLAARLGVPVVPGFDASDDQEALLQAAQELGFPLMVKAAAGGGGRGLRAVYEASALSPALEAARREALAAFGDGRLLLERLIERPRHLEIQLLADRYGRVVSLGERECSLQRRHQKVLEEAPSPAVSPALREQMSAAARRLARAVNYVGVGTVEMLLDPSGAFYFLEMNTRLQVEHPVTEEVTGLDLVAWQLRVALGEALPFPPEQEAIPLRGWAIEARVCAEDPARDLLPATGELLRFAFDEGVRVDAGPRAGLSVSPFYDSLLAKVIAWGEDREVANRRLHRALRRAWIPGVATNLPVLRDVTDHPAWRAGELDTGFLQRHGLIRPPPLNPELAALGVILAGHLGRAGGPARSWPASWRLGGPAEQRDEVRVGADTLPVRWTVHSPHQIAVQVGEGPKRILRWHGGAGSPPDPLLVEVDGVIRAWRLAATRWPPGEGDTVYLHDGDAEAMGVLEPRFPPPPAEGVVGGLVAPTPGKVVAVAVAVGDLVQAGQRLVVLEAMKMEHAVLAPEPGRVVEVRAVVGRPVDQGQLLVRLEPEGDEGEQTR